jgi:hypothetical protein
MSKKTITINPDLFKVSSTTGKSRKKRDPNDPNRPAIKIRSPNAKPNTLRSKNHMLRFIRKQQENTYKNILNNDIVKPSSNIETGFNTDFDESLKYMISLTEEQKQAKDLKNKTLKHYPSSNGIGVSNDYQFQPTVGGSTPIEEFVNTTVPDVFTQYPSYGPLVQPLQQSLRFPQPQYGCMKYGGTLPTYRQLHNTTQRKIPQQQQQQQQSIQIPSATTQAKEPEYSNVANFGGSSRVDEIKKTAEKMQSIQQAKPPKLKYPKQRRTVRRTFRLGKSKVHPKVSVLVSNRTLRNNITTKSHLLKKTPIPEIKRFLIKKGFIKIGTSAPNDVLRKMYESASMICGEVQNHNPENLLYNYFNDVDSTSK